MTHYSMHLSQIIQQKNDEQIEILLRRHWISYLPMSLTLIMVNIITFVIYYMISVYYGSVLDGDVGRAIVYLVLSVLLLSGWLQFYNQFIDYYLDLWVITNSRIVNVEQAGLFGRTISELDLYKVQDVTSEVKGFWRSMFQYGFVYVQTAGETERFVFENIPNAHEVRKQILDLVDSNRRLHAKEIMTEDT